MKNTKEIKAILTAIFAINKTSEREDKDISRILEYAFRRLFESNTNIYLKSSTMHFEDFSNRTQIYSYSPA